MLKIADKPLEVRRGSVCVMPMGRDIVLEIAHGGNRIRIERADIEDVIASLLIAYGAKAKATP